MGAVGGEFNLEVIRPTGMYTLYVILGK